MYNNTPISMTEFFKEATSGDLTPITILVQCDPHLARVTGYRHSPAVINNGQPFGLFFHCWLCSHPEVMIKFPPGQLAFSLNGRTPPLMQPLQDGDHIEFWGIPHSATAHKMM